MSGKEKVSNLHPRYVQQYDAYIERQKRRRKRLMRRLVLFSIVAMLAIGSMTAYHMKQRDVRAEKKEQYEQLEKKMTNLDKQEEKLSREIELLNDEEYVLEIARTNYFFSKKGELIFKIPDEKPSY